MTEPFMTDPPNMDRSLVEVAKTAPGAGTSSATDAELITAARSGEAAAFGTLYERHAAAARRLARQLVKHQADVDDVVAETFARVLSALRRGNGPVEAFRPYLLTAVRRVAIDMLRGQRNQVPTDDLPDPGEPFDDPAVADLDRSLITKAFLSLPERWSAVLWHTEVEDAKPAEVASLLGVSANSVAALRYRAREGLRQAYLQLHLSGRAEGTCRPVAARLGAYVRGRLSTKNSREVAEHLCGCPSCAAAFADLTAINDALRGVLAPVVLGAAADGYLKLVAHEAASSGAAAGGTATTGHGAAAAHSATAAHGVTASGAAAAHGALTQGTTAQSAAAQSTVMPGGAAAQGGSAQGAAAHGAAANSAAVHGSTGHGLAGVISRHSAGAGRLIRLAVQRPAGPITAAVAAASIAVPTLVLLHPSPRPESANPPLTISRGHDPAPQAAGAPGTKPRPGGAGPSASPEPSATPSVSGPGNPRQPKPPHKSASPRPSPSTSPTVRPSSSPSSSPTTAPSPTPTPSNGTPVAVAAKLAVGVNVGSLLNLGVTAVVNVDVSDTGNAGTGPLTATLTLPAGTLMLGLSGSSTWSCTNNASGGTCSHGAISAGTAANFSFQMLVISLSGCGTSVLANVVSGDVSGSGSSPQQVQCSGGLLRERAPGYLILYA